MRNDPMLQRWLLRWRAPPCGARRRLQGRRRARSTQAAALASTLARTTAGSRCCSLNAGCSAGVYAGARRLVARGGGRASTLACGAVITGQLPYPAFSNQRPAPPFMPRDSRPLRRRPLPLDVTGRRRLCPFSGPAFSDPTSRPPPLAATGILGSRAAPQQGSPSLRCGASSTFIPSLLQRHGRKKVGSLRSAIGLLAADVGTTWAAREGVQQGARHHNA